MRLKVILYQCSNVSLRVNSNCLADRLSLSFCKQHYVVERNHSFFLLRFNTRSRVTCHFFLCFLCYLQDRFRDLPHFLSRLGGKDTQAHSLLEFALHLVQLVSFIQVVYELHFIITCQPKKPMVNSFYVQKTPIK